MIFGPVVRSHAHDVNKKVRALALKVALSSKAADGKLVVLETAATGSLKTKDLAAQRRVLLPGADDVPAGAPLVTVTV